MELIKDTHYEGERPLFATHNLHLEYGKRDGLRLCIERGIFRLAFQKSASGELQDFRYTAALLCPRSDYGKLHDDRRCRPRF